MANNAPSDPPPAKATFPKRVRATRQGFFNGQLVPEGRTFTITSGKQFSKHWMQEVDPSTPDELAELTQPRRRHPSELPATAKTAPQAKTRSEAAGQTPARGDDSVI